VVRALREVVLDSTSSLLLKDVQLVGAARTAGHSTGRQRLRCDP
jgi:hypothetical protein